MFKFLPRANEIQLPVEAQTTLEQLAEGLRGQGLTVRLVGSDRLHAHQPPSDEANPLSAQRWLPGGRMIIEQTATGITISHRVPILRVAASSLFLGIMSVGVFAASPGARWWIGAGVTVGSVLFHLMGHRRASTVLVFGTGRSPVNHIPSTPPGGVV